MSATTVNATSAASSPSAIREYRRNAAALFVVLVCAYIASFAGAVASENMEVPLRAFHATNSRTSSISAMPNVASRVATLAGSIDAASEPIRDISHGNDATPVMIARAEALSSLVSCVEVRAKKVNA